MKSVLDIAALTIRETQRRRILWVALFMGVAFLLIFGLGFHYIFSELEGDIQAQRFQPQRPTTQIIANFLMMSGLYVINFLVIVMAALLSAGTLSGEVESHTIETLLTKPLYRWQVVLGKWLGYALIVSLYMLILAVGVIAITRWRSDLEVSNLPSGLSLMLLAGLTMLSLSIAGSTRLSTLANGALAFMLYSLAFIGSWVEQIGAVLRNETAVDLGILSSLLMPADALWKKASLLFQPQGVTDFELAGPFVVMSQPNERMTLYGVLYVVILLLLALWSFSRRDL